MTQKKPPGVTYEQCERAVKALNASNLKAALVVFPPDFGVWLDGVLDEEFKEAYSFRLHEEEIESWSSKE